MNWVHAKQFLEGKRSDSKTAYVERPLEIEYNITVEEAKTISLSENEIIDLNSELVNDEELNHLVITLGIEYLDQRKVSSFLYA